MNLLTKKLSGSGRAKLCQSIPFRGHTTFAVFVLHHNKAPKISLSALSEKALVCTVLESDKIEPKMSLNETALVSMVQELDKIETSLKLAVARTDAERVTHSGGRQLQKDTVTTVSSAGGGEAQTQVVCTCSAHRQRALSSWQSELP